MSPRVWLSLIMSMAVLAGAGPGWAATTIKLATLVPDGSLWDKELKQMGSEWRQRTGGRVGLRIYAGGVAGDESDVVRKMRIGQLNAATLTVVGLAELDDGFNVFAIPRFFDTYDELFHVAEALTPTFEKRLAERGYVFLNWGHAGWVHLFSTKPVQTPEDVKSLKLFASAGDNKMVQWWKRNGYRPVPLAATDILTGLQTGLIEALPTTPLAALTLQWYRATPYMFDLGLAPLVGATVVSERTWKGISAEDQEVLRASGQRVEERLEASVPEQDQKAIEEMQKRGLELTSPQGGEMELWESEAARYASTMAESRVPQDVFELARQARDAYRAKASR